MILVQDVPDPGDPATWTFQLQCTWKNSGNDDPSDYKILRQRAETFAEPFKSANLWVPEGTEILTNFLSFWQTVPWDNKDGRITLCGDAAHPMTFRKLIALDTHRICR
jgi:2-polyprenyl-6-methoxyphenol hydroxylase-like FAD-dependent oxidoreductase